MKCYYELDVENFHAWSGAVWTLEKIKEEDKISEFESLLEEMYPDGEISESELNDYLWFEPEQIFESIGIKTERQIKEEIEELEEQLEELETNQREIYEDWTDESTEWKNTPERQFSVSEKEWEEYSLKLWESDYKSDYDDFSDQIAEVEDSLEELKEELEDYYN